MKILSFEGTPDEFARVQHLFASGIINASPAVETTARSDNLSWCDFTAEQRYAIACHCLEQTTEDVRRALIALWRLEDDGQPTVMVAWADEAGMREDELCGHIAELARGIRRVTVDLYGDATPVNARGAAGIIVKKDKAQGEPTFFGIRAEARQAMADAGILDEHEE